MSEFVFIIESPTADDLSHHRYESDLLRQAVELSDTTCIVQMVDNKQAFESAISKGLWEAAHTNRPSDPILHISAHGSSNGIRLTNNDFVTWCEMRDLLAPLSKVRQSSLLLCMSTCQGLDAITMAFSEKPGTQEAVYAVIGTPGKPTWSDTAVAYASFYHLRSKGSMLRDAVKAMDVASGYRGFQILLSFVERNKKLFPGSDEKLLL